MIIQKKCVICNSIHDIEVTQEQLDEIAIPLRHRKRFIQDIFPSPKYTSEQRELFMSGQCNICWDKIFTPEDEESEDELDKEDELIDHPISYKDSSIN